MEEVVLEEKTYVASKKAATECGYTQDYVGQLCRSGQIDAKRVSGQWYVFLESLQGYKNKAATFKPEPPKYQPDPAVEASITIEGNEYVSAALAAKLTGYNQDYVGQIARAGKIPSQQIGNRWYLQRETLLAHKQEKDSLLRAVQAEAVGLKRPDPVAYAPYSAYSQVGIKSSEMMTYNADDKPLFPEFNKKEEHVQEKADDVTPIPIHHDSRIPIHIASERPVAYSHASSHQINAANRAVAIPRKSIFTKIFLPLAMVSVLVIMIGAAGLNRDAIFATFDQTNISQPAAVGNATERIAEVLEQILTKELVYTRS